MTKQKVKDKLNRPLRDLRISVIDRCNFRCQYCMPADLFGPNFAFLPKSELLSYEEIERVAHIFVGLGVEKIRLTGGEPLLRKDLPILVEKIASIEGLKDIGLTTNGVLLPKYANELKAAGLQRVNVSLDSLNDELFGQINGRNVGTKPVLDGIHAARDAGLGVKINMVVKKGLNDTEIVPMAQYCKDHGLQLRFIEYMDVGSTNGWKMDDVVTKKEMYNLLKNISLYSQLIQITMGKWQNDTDMRIIRLKLVLSHLFLNLFVQVVRDLDFLQMDNYLLACLMEMDMIFVIL